MAHDPGSDPASPRWGAEQPLFAPRSDPGERPRVGPGHAGPVDDPFRGPLFGDPPSRARRGATPSARPATSDAGRDGAWPPPGISGASPDDPGEMDADDRWDGQYGDQQGGRYGGGQGGQHGDEYAESSEDEVFPRARRADRGSGAGASGGGRDDRRGGAASFFRELPVLLLIAFLLAFLLRTFVVQVFYIPSSSMEPTLQINDRMAVEKLTYLFRDPRRGEIVVFEGEELGQTDPDASVGERVVRGFGQFLGVVPASARDYVKRVIGLPGDEILIEDGQVFVNGHPIDEPYVVYPDGASFGPVTVPDDSLFFLGDNRPNSSDSRRGLGFVPMDDVVGRSFVTIWPPDNMGSLTGVEHELPGDP